jgi:hypothetical protein
VKPIRPKSLPEIAEQLLARISKEALACEIVIGGGIALKHYADFRPTQDIDAWWRSTRNLEALQQISKAVAEIAAENDLDVSHRNFGSTDSIELRITGENRKKFSFQIAVRDITLEEPLASAWSPILIETLRENMGSKMNALVNRGAPRDFMDVYEVVMRGLMSGPECWRLWQLKNPEGSVEQAKADVLAALQRIVQRRSVDSLSGPEREAAIALRTWYSQEFARGAA